MQVKICAWSSSSLFARAHLGPCLRRIVGTMNHAPINALFGDDRTQVTSRSFSEQPQPQTLQPIDNGDSGELEFFPSVARALFPPEAGREQGQRAA